MLTETNLSANSDADNSEDQTPPVAQQCPNLVGKEGEFLSLESLKAEIPYSVAYNAHQGTSFSPETRALQRQNEYAQILLGDYQDLLAVAKTPEKVKVLQEQFPRYRSGFRRRYMLWLHSRSRVMSAMITGPAKFPVRSNLKKAGWAENKAKDLEEFRERALKAIRKAMFPELRPIMSGDSDALARLKEELEMAEAYHKKMKLENAAHKAFLKNPASLDKYDLPEESKRMIRNFKSPYSWEPHPNPPYRLQNHSANMRRIKGRIEQISKAKEMPDKEFEGTKAKVTDCPAENRIRIRFPGIPTKEVRDQLKKSGFKWAPSLGVWQAYRNNRAVVAVREIAGIIPKGGN